MPPVANRTTWRPNINSDPTELALKFKAVYDRVFFDACLENFDLIVENQNLKRLNRKLLADAEAAKQVSAIS